MAKGNMLLGFARNKLGDLVFSRTGGQQVIRARNRAPKNPNSDKQLVQRAIMANVMQLYSAGQAILNHSFQGKAVGAANQREFIRINTNKLRALVVADINGNLAAADCKGRVGARGLNVAVPFDGMQVSKGTYQQALFTNDGGGFVMPTPVANETVAAYAQRVGLVADDLYTFVAYGVSFTDVVASLNIEEENPSGNYDRQYNCRFEYVQLKVKAGLSAVTDTITADSLLSVLFDVYSYSSEPLGDLKISDKILINDIMSYADNGAFACIRSREFEDLRSTSYLIVSNNTYGWGFASEYLLDVWATGTTLQGTDLILEGSNFSQAGGSAAPTLPDVSDLSEGYYYVPSRLAYGPGNVDWEENAIAFVDPGNLHVDIAIFNDQVTNDDSAIIFEDNEVKQAHTFDPDELEVYVQSFIEWLNSHYQNSEDFDFDYTSLSSLARVTHVIGSL